MFKAFRGWKKTYMNNILTVVSKTVKRSISVPRKTLNSNGLVWECIPPVKNKTTVHNLILNAEQELKNEVDRNKKRRSRTLSVEEELFFTLTRLRCGILVEDMSVRFNLSTSHISRILITWIDFLYSQLRMLPIWDSKYTVVETMLTCFKELYPSTRVILDCTEIFIEMPTSYRSESATFSNYKHHNTAKGLIGIAPNGAVTFVSDLYAGRVCDRKITAGSGIYTLLEPGDSVMADRGFELDDDLPEGVSLNIPPFMRGKSQLSMQEETETR